MEIHSWDQTKAKLKFSQFSHTYQNISGADSESTAPEVFLYSLIPAELHQLLK